jgi:hypothetical protein
MARRTGLRGRFWIAAVTAVLAVVTLVSREWIEVLFHVDPDGGDGTLEWAIVLTLAIGSVLLGLFASMEWRHAMSQRAD